MDRCRWAHRFAGCGVDYPADDPGRTLERFLAALTYELFAKPAEARKLWDETIIKHVSKDVHMWLEYIALERYGPSSGGGGGGGVIRGWWWLTEVV